MYKKLVGLIVAISVVLITLPALNCCAPAPEALTISSIVVTTNSDTSVTISWATNRDATGMVDYGTTTTYGSESSTTASGTEHSVTLTGLTAGQTYNYKVTVTAADDVTASSANKTFNTTQLVISDISYVPNNRGAVISWSTDDPSSSQVQWGLTTAYGSTSTLDATLEVDHSVAIDGCTPETVYHYKVLSVSASGSAESADQTLTTGDKEIVLMGSTSQPSTDNPFKMGIGAGDGTHQNMLYEPLIRSMFSDDPEGGLAESWSYDADDMIWTINIHPDAKFSDGTKVTAEDAVFSLNTQIDFVMGQISDLVGCLEVSDASTPAAPGLTIELVHNADAADALVRNTGSFVTDGWVDDDFVKVTGTIDGPDKGTDGDQDGQYKIKSVTETTLTLYDHHTLTAEPAIENKISLSGGVVPGQITVVDVDTLEIQVALFRAAFIRYLGNTAIVPKAEWEDMSTVEMLAYANADPIGSGPFTLVERELDSHTIYAANLDYWGGTPAIDGLQNLWYADDEAELLALKLGDIDFTSHFGMPSAIPQLTADPDIKIFPITANTTISFYGNWRHEPWNLKAFRQAANLAINRQDIVNFAANGWGAIPPMIERDSEFEDMVGLEEYWQWPGLAIPDHDDRIDAANAMLDDITGMSATPPRIVGGVDDGKMPVYTRTYNAAPLVFDCEAATSFANQLAAAEQVKEDLAELGIVLNMVPETSTTLVNNVYRQKSDATLADWETHVWGRAFESTFDYLANQYQLYESGESGSLTARSYILGLEGATYEALGADLITLQGLPEGDATRDALIESSIITMAEELYAIPLYSSIAPAVYRTDRFTGWTQGNGYLFYGAIQALADARNIMKLTPIQ